MFGKCVLLWCSFLFVVLIICLAEQNFLIVYLFVCFNSIFVLVLIYYVSWGIIKHPDLLQCSEAHSNQSVMLDFTVSSIRMGERSLVSLFCIYAYLISQCCLLKRTIFPNSISSAPVLCVRWLQTPEFASNLSHLSLGPSSHDTTMLCWILYFYTTFGTYMLSCYVLSN